MKKVFLSAGILSLLATSGAVTVTVDGVGGGSTTFAKLSQAVAYVNANPSEPNIINVTASHTDDTQMQILVPVTINGDLGNTGTPAEIGVSRAPIMTASDIGRTERAYIEIEAAGNVTVNNLRIFCLDANAASPIVNGIVLYKPASGTSNYTFNKLQIGGSSNGAYVPATDTDPYYATNARFWYGFGAANGVVVASNTGGGGTYNSTFNDCHVAMARSSVFLIANKSGTTVINGGVVGAAGENCIRVDGATGVTIKGTSTNRLRILTANRSSAGNSIRVLNAAAVDLIQYVDIVNNPAGTQTASLSTGSGLYVDGASVVTSVDHVRAGRLWAYGMHIINGTVTVTNSTFHASGTAAAALVDPIRIDNGTLTISDSILTSKNLGKILINGGTVNLNNNAIPTDGDASESLNASPITGTPASNTGAIASSPTYAGITFTQAAADNMAFLRPTEAAYATAHTGGTPLNGGAGVDQTSVQDWNLY